MFDYINNYYGLHVELGTRVKMEGKPGEVTGARSAHVLVLFDGEKEPVPCHPTWQMEYIY